MTTASSQTAVVLGGTGFLGRNVCVAFRDAGYDVVAVGRSAVEPPAGCRPLSLDLVETDPRQIAGVLRSIGPATVVNAAGALWAIDGVQLTAQQVADGNLRLVENLLAALGEQERPTRLLQLGSTYEYGAQLPGTVLTEETVEQPVARYGIVKLEAFQLVREAARAGIVEAVTLRLTSSIGPWAPAASLMGRLARGLAANPERLEIPALEGERDFVDARDAAAAVLAAARRPVVRDLFNIAGAARVPVADAVDLLIKVSGQDPEIVWLPRVAGRDDAGAIGTQLIDIGAAREHLGWQPRYTLAESMAALWESVSSPAAGRPGSLRAGRT